MASGNGSSAIKLASPNGKAPAPSPSPRLVRKPPVIPSSVPSKTERHFMVEVGPDQIRSLVELIEYDGLPKVAEYMRVDPSTVLRVCAGLLHTCRPETRHRIKAFFATK
jgi:hypothetical protein